MLPGSLIAVAATLAVVAAVVASGCGGSDRLDALQADPLGKFAPAGGQLGRTTSSKEGKTLGKPSPAKFSRWFSLGTTDPAAALAEARRVAETAGWRLEEAGGGTSLVGAKDLAGGAASAVIGVRGEGDFVPSGVTAPALEITLQR